MQPATVPTVRAVTVVPDQGESAAMTEVDEPPEADGRVLVETLPIGVCATDLERPDDVKAVIDFTGSA